MRLLAKAAPPSIQAFCSVRMTIKLMAQQEGQYYPGSQEITVVCAAGAVSSRQLTLLC